MGSICSKTEDRNVTQEIEIISGDTDYSELHVCLNDSESRPGLQNKDISKVTEIVSADNRFKFSVTWLGIKPNEYKKIEAEAQFNHHDTLFECIRQWKNKTEAEGINAKDELIRILLQIRKGHGWFSDGDVEFLTEVTGMKIPESRLQRIQDWTQLSLKRRLQKSLSHDWIHEKTSHKFPLRQYYVQLQWKKKIRQAMRSETITLTSVHELIKQLRLSASDGESSAARVYLGRHNSSSVIIEGEGGIGKSCSLGMLALDWAENMRPELEQFQFVFLVLLRHVEGNDPLEHIIMQQHGRLVTEKVSPSEVKAIVHGETNGNILLMFDGYDEYTEGTNDDIDKLLLNGKDNCLIIVSSRSGDFLFPIRFQMDEEVYITGFSYENIIKCAEQYLGTDESCQVFLSQAEEASIHCSWKPKFRDMSLYTGLLHVPIILLMACTVFLENQCLPSSKTGLFRQVVHMCISRTTLKTMGKTASEVANLHQLMVKLGKLAWMALNRETKQLLIYKNDVIAESEEILKLGLLFGEDIQATTEDLPPVLSFQHKLLQEYLAAVYIADNSKVDTAFVTEAFLNWDKISIHREVVNFACGLLGDTDASPITNHAANILTQLLHDDINDGETPRIMNYSKDFALLESFQKEGMVPTSEYPACGYPLAEVLASTELVYITDIDEKDTLDLNPGTAEIIVKLEEVERWKYDRLWQALHTIPAIVIALHLVEIGSPNVTKLSHFSDLKYLFISDSNISEAAMEDLSESIEAWGPEPELMYCNLDTVPISSSVLTGLCKCTNLKHLDLEFCDLHSKLSVLMDNPAQGLKHLILVECSLHGDDVGHMTQAISEGRLTHLEELSIQGNPVGEVAMGNLLETLVLAKTYTELKLEVWDTGVSKYARYTALSDQFVNEWKAKLADTHIQVTLTKW